MSEAVAHGPYVDPQWDEERWQLSRAAYRITRAKSYGPSWMQIRLRAQLFAKQNGACYYCDRQMVKVKHTPGRRAPDEQVTLEHLVSHIDGGTTNAENCRAACFLCNNLKSKLDKSIRSLERSMREGFAHEVHYYASRLRVALDQWEARIASADNGQLQ